MLGFRPIPPAINVYFLVRITSVCHTYKLLVWVRQVELRLTDMFKPAFKLSSSFCSQDFRFIGGFGGIHLVK